MSDTIPRRSRIDALFFVFTLIGSLVCLVATVTLVLVAVQVQPVSRSGQSEASLWGALTFGLMFLISLPGVYRAWRGWRRDPAPPSKPKLGWTSALILAPLGVCLAGIISIRTGGVDFLSSVGYTLGIGSVIIGITLVMRLLGPPLSPRRAWGHFLIGLWAMPAIALIFEILLFIPSLVLLGVGLMLTPDGRTMIDMLTPILTRDTWLLTDSLLELSLQPWVVGLMLFNIAFLVPLLEEAIKTLATLPFLRRNLTPAQGFLGGALAGAGFSLFEALFVAEPGQAAIAIMIGRTGTTLMHVFTAAITNWALVRATRDRKWAIFGLTYLGAVGMHALWNASSVGMGLAAIILESDQSGPSAGFAGTVTCTGSLILMSLVGFTLIALPWIIRRLARSEEVEV